MTRITTDAPAWPHRIEFAEIGNGSSTTKGAIAMTLKDSYGQFNRLRQHGGGVLRS